MNTELLDSEYTEALGYMAPYMKAWQMGEQSFVEEKINQAITDVVENRKNSTSILRNVQEEINQRLAVSNK